MVSMSEKSEERGKKGIRKHLRTFLEKLKEGLSPGLVRDRLIPHDTLNWLINLFREEGLIYKDRDGRYYFIWKREREELLKEYQEFKTAEEYKVKLVHSKDLIRRRPSTLKTPKSENKYLLQHLETGYPDIYNLYEEWKGIYEEIERVEEGFKAKVNEVAKVAGIEVLPITDPRWGSKGVRAVNENIYKVVARCLEEGRKANLCTRRRTRGDKIITWIHDEASGLPLTNNEELMGDLQALINRALGSNEVVREYGRLKELQRILEGARSRYIEAVSNLIVRINNMEPLRGHCDLCPRILIGRHNTER